MSEGGDLERLAERISDRLLVDWPGEYLARPDLKSLLDHLRAIEAVAAAHRTLPDRGPASTSPTLPAPVVKSAVDQRPPPKQIRHYKIEGVLGSGGMGIVYLARDVRLDRRVAIKAVPDALAADSQGMHRFRREAKLLASLNHPHIATVYGLETERGRSYLVMEWVEGKTLATRLSLGPLSREEALRFCMQVAQALEAAHERGVIHRDLKPGNVMFGPNGAAKVLDFGLAKRVVEAARPNRQQTIATSFVTDSLVRVGTPGYMSPEQVVGDVQDERTDVFAFGCLLYESLTGRRTFSGESAAELLTAALATEPEWTALPIGTPRAVRRLLKRCLQKDPERRGSMAEARRELEAGLQRLETRRLGSAPPPMSADGSGQSPHNLPHEGTSFVGRELEIAECLDLIAGERLVTLTGIGGAGKTRLALKLAADSLIDTPGGAWFVDLAPVIDVARVPAAVADALGVREEPGAPLIRTLAVALRERHALLVLDNCEHVAAACVEVVEALLKETPLRIVATSREALGIPGERIYAVPPLSVPPQDESVSVPEMMGYEAVELLLERARRADPGLLLDEGNAPAIADICRRLDGIPLALELAAARARVLSVEEIGARLDERFRLLTSTGEALPARHQRLQSVIAWSYEHLGEDEQRLLRALSVFSAGARLEAAAAVCVPGADEFEVLDSLTHLVEKSLVAVVRLAARPSRYHMLETVRQYARARLDEASEARAVRDRHLDFFLALAEEAEPNRGAALSTLRAENDNLLAAVAWSEADDANPEKMLRLTGALGWYWYERGEFAIGRRAIDAALAKVGLAPKTREFARVLYGAGAMALFQGDVAAARPHLERYLELCEYLADSNGIAMALNGLGLAAMRAGEYAEADRRFVATLEAYRDVNDQEGMGKALHNLGVVALSRADDAEALRYMELALDHIRRARAGHQAAITLAFLALLLVHLNRLPEARAHLVECFRLVRVLGAKRPGAHALEATAQLAARSEPALAARLLGIAAGLREAIASPLWPAEQALRDGFVDELRTELGSTQYDRESVSGLHQSFEKSVEEAVAWLERPGESCNSP